MYVLIWGSISHFFVPRSLWEFAACARLRQSMFASPEEAVGLKVLVI